MQPATKRVKSIYSVIASSNRLEILRILNTKGPLSYSELKALAGFKSKKESGKFAYHLRKLVKQMLISLNRSERKYTVTNLGRLVLNLTRQIEEQSIIESGKLYVRTSRHTMEEFNADRILQSLVREAGMPVELAQKITSETEARLYKFQTNYLTAPLIREMVNSLLIEHGYEEYRHRLTRLGLPVYDVTEMVNRAGSTSANVEAVMAQTAQAVFSEYLFLAQLPRDVADAHLAGDIHITNSGNWGLMPDTLFIDLLPLQADGIKISTRYLSTPRVSAPTNLEEAVSAFLTLASLLSDEASTEISFRNIVPYFAKYVSNRSEEDLKKHFQRLFTLLPLGLNHFYTRPIVSINLLKFGGEEIDLEDNILSLIEEMMLEAYEDYVSKVTAPMVKVIENLQPEELGSEKLVKISSLVRQGGSIAVETKTDTVCSYLGLRKKYVDNSMILHSLSLNLPRLAYDSNRDETYFRAKLAMLLQLSVNALIARKGVITDMIRRGLLPTIGGNPSLSSSEKMPLIINLTGLNEAILNLVGERAPIAMKRSVTAKSVETAVKVVTERCEKLGEVGGVAIMNDDSATRFASLDAEKYGRAVASVKGKIYSQTPLLQKSDILNQGLFDEISSYFNLLNGGYSVILDMPRDGGVKEGADLIGEGAKRFSFFRLQQHLTLCKNCGAKFSRRISRCRSCRSTMLTSYRTL